MTTEIDWNDESARSAHIQSLIETEVAGLKAKNNELLTTNKSLSGKAKLADEVDIEKYNKMIADEQARETELARKSGEFDKLLAKEQQRYSEGEKNWKTRESSLVGIIDKSLRGEAAAKAIAEAGGSVELLLPHLLNRSRLSEKDGMFGVEVLDKDNLPMAGKSYADILEEFKKNDSFAGAFASKVATGTGAAAASGSKSTTANPFVRGPDYNVGEQMRLMKNEPDKAKRLQAEAAAK
ncbi:hypothetical protein [Phenylobacterium sp. SCN 70-31]|mgnify:CR=1 FL=1|uniref:hypothetical protein n=1 Tax=Phenylobacterium sp. SCN 70-31 TaxID=1660129 RepID=UPI0025E1FC9D|nr:hypothetical protein [Phenylobacterium sp. SCN 70-31]